jgi:hypothetical protein
MQRCSDGSVPTLATCCCEAVPRVDGIAARDAQRRPILCSVQRAAGPAARSCSGPAGPRASRRAARAVKARRACRPHFCVAYSWPSGQLHAPIWSARPLRVFSPVARSSCGRATSRGCRVAGNVPARRRTCCQVILVVLLRAWSHGGPTSLGCYVAGNVPVCTRFSKVSRMVVQGGDLTRLQLFDFTVPYISSGLQARPRA